jgi:hypothetical protein
MIKKLVPICAKNNDNVHFIVQKIADNSMELVQNPYGNYAIQAVLESFDVTKLSPILESFKGKYSQLSNLKFSSNVIEKCMEKADPKRKEEIIKELISPEKLFGIHKKN